MRSWSSKTWAGNPDSLVPEAWAKITSQRLLLTANRNQDFIIFICTIFGSPPNFVLIHIKTFYNKMYCVCAHTHSRNKMIPISWWRVWPQALQICEEVLRGWVPACLGRICNQDPKQQHQQSCPSCSICNWQRLYLKLRLKLSPEAKLSWTYGSHALGISLKMKG